MINDKVITIIKREINAKLLSKGFIAMTILVPVFLFGILALQTYFIGIDSEDFASLIIITEDEKLSYEIQKEISENELLQKNFSFNYEVKDSIQTTELIENQKSSLIANELTGIVFISNNNLYDKKINYFSKNPTNRQLFDKLDDALNQALLNWYFTDKEISEDDLQFARSWVDIKGFRVSDKDEIEEEGIGNQVLSFLFSFLLYFSLLLLGSFMMQAVIEEKSNRIVEVLLSSATSQDLMVGKILGNALTGLLQMAIWLSPLMILISTSWFVLPKEFILSISWGNIFYFLVNYFIALTTFLGLFSCVGAMFDNPQDAQQGVFPLMLLIMIPFFMTFALQKNPDSTFATIISIAPITSLIVMPARITLVDVSLIQLVGSLFLSILFLVFVFILAGKIYRVAILSTGSKPTLAIIFKWLKAK